MFRLSMNLFVYDNLPRVYSTFKCKIFIVCFINKPNDSQLHIYTFFLVIPIYEKMYDISKIVMQTHKS